MPNFQKVKDAYDSYYKELLGQGKFPVKDTKIGFWGAAVTDEVQEALRKSGLRQSHRFIDLGSGDGKVTLLASLMCKEAHGVEYAEELHRKSQAMAKSLGVSNSKFFNYDFHDHALGDYDTIFINPDKPMSRGTEKKIVSELNGNLVVYGHHFHPSSLTKVKDFMVDSSLVTVFAKK